MAILFRYLAYLQGLNDDHKSFYSWGWLEARKRKKSPFPYKTTYWDASIAEKPPSVAYEAVMESDAGVKEWTSLIRHWGFCFVDGCPPTGEATRELIERIALIRHTHYGGFWQFTSDLAKKDSAYTTQQLGAHTDTTYFTDPAGLQTFHLISHTGGDGGASLLVDGFRAAAILRQESPRAFDYLAKRSVPTHASGNDGMSIRPARSFPVFTRQGFSKADKDKISQVRWNNDDRAVLPAYNREATASFYSAARKWVEILTRKDSEYWVQLEPGRPLTFNNWRVLHGRSAFTGQREMCGAYTNMDDFISRWKNLNFPKELIMNNV